MALGFWRILFQECRFCFYKFYSFFSFFDVVFLFIFIVPFYFIYATTFKHATKFDLQLFAFGEILNCSWNYVLQTHIKSIRWISFSIVWNSRNSPQLEIKDRLLIICNVRQQTTMQGFIRFSKQWQTTARETLCSRHTPGSAN